MGLLYSSSSEALAAIRASGRLPHHSRVDGNRRQPTVRKLARVARTTESPLAEFNKDSKGRGRLAEFNGDSESPDPNSPRERHVRFPLSRLFMQPADPPETRTPEGDFKS